jgi:hypothetical protein
MDEDTNIFNNIFDNHIDFFNQNDIIKEKTVLKTDNKRDQNKNKIIKSFEEFTKIKENKKNYNLYRKNKDLEKEINTLKDENLILKIKLEQENRYKKIITYLFTTLSIFTCINLGNQISLCYSSS